MSEIRERAQKFVNSSVADRGNVIYDPTIINDLLAELEKVEAERDRLAHDALTVLAGVVCTPIEGFVKVPYELKTGILELRKMKESAEQRIAELEAENTSAMREASSLAKCLYKKYYAEESPDFRLCDTPAGVMTQIDNMITGTPDIERKQAARDCVEEMESYPTSVSVHATAHDAKVASATKQALVEVVKVKFNLEDK